MSFNVESSSEEDSEESGGSSGDTDAEEPNDGGQAVTSWKAVIQLLNDMAKSGPQMGSGDAQSQFSAGYGSSPDDTAGAAGGSM